MVDNHLEYENFLKGLRNKVKEEMDARGLTQTQLENLCHEKNLNITQSTISSILTGSRPVALKTYLNLIKSNKPEIVDSLIFECLVNNAELANTYGSYELFLNRIEHLKREIKDPVVMEYILYYLKKFNEDKPKLVDMLDEMGDKYEN